MSWNPGVDLTAVQKQHPNCRVPFLPHVWLQPRMSELLLPFDPAASAESPAAPVQPPGARADCHKVPLSGSCEYMQPARGLLQEVGGHRSGPASRSCTRCPRGCVSGCGSGWLSLWGGWNNSRLQAPHRARKMRKSCAQQWQPDNTHRRSAELCLAWMARGLLLIVQPLLYYAGLPIPSTSMPQISYS